MVASEQPALARTPSAASSSSKKEDTETAKPITTVTPYENRTRNADTEKSAGTDLVRRAASNEAVDEAYNLAGEVAIEYTEEEERAVRAKCDRQILPILTLVYFSQYLDKTLLNYASITGLPIKGTDYSNVSAAFYYGYLACIYIQSFVAQKCNPAKYLGINVVFWGIVVACHAAAPSFSPFFALRFLLGGFESVVAPTLIMTIAAFYPKREQGKRIASFYMANGLTDIVGSLVAYGTTFYSGDGLGGEGNAWRLLYIVFGAAAFCVGLVVLFFLPASPTHARFLTDREKRISLERIRQNSAGTTGSKKWKVYQLKDAAVDPKVWLALLFTILTSLPNGALSNFSSLIIKQFGYTSRETLLVGIPGGAVAVLFTLGTAFLSDRISERILPAIICIVPTIVGLAILVGFGEHPNKHRGAALFAIYLSKSFGSSLSIIYAWLATNLGGSSKKQIVTYSNSMIFAVGNIAGSYVFTANTAPSYVPGKLAVMICLIVSLAVCVLLRLLVTFQQRRKAAGIEKLKSEKGWTDADIQREREAAAFKDLTDRENPYFQYMS